jgi:hypothetical protein
MNDGRHLRHPRRKRVATTADQLVSPQKTDTSSTAQKLIPLDWSPAATKRTITGTPPAQTSIGTETELGPKSPSLSWR